MPTAITASRAAVLKNSLRKSLYLAAAMACLWPPLAQAQTWNPTASDLHGNTAAGDDALANHGGGGGQNVGIGVNALYANTTGSNNTASGASALNANTAGSNNTASGARALVALAAGGSNIALGANAGQNLTNGSRNIYLGHNGAASESNVIRIGQLQTKTFIAGIAGVAASGATVVVRANGQLGVVASSARYKTDIRDLSDASDRLGQLHPVSYQYKTEPGVTHFGLIAEEVDKVMPELVVRDEQNRPETVQYQELIPLLLQQWKVQQGEIAHQRALIERQQAELTDLRRMLATRLAALGEVSRAGGAGSR